MLRLFGVNQCLHLEEIMNLVEPANPPSRKAPLVWAIGAAIPWLVLAVARWCGSRSIGGWLWLHAAAAAVTVLGIVVFVVVVPLWRYRVHRWDISPQAVYTRTGWLVQERRIAPISRVQTVDTYRGPLDRLFGLANVTVTTASSAGAVRIVALDSEVADRVVAQLTDIAAIGARGRDVTVDAGQAWQRLSPRMLLVHPVHEVLRQIPLLIGSVVLGFGDRQPDVGVARAGADRRRSAWPAGSPPPTASSPTRCSCAPACCSARCFRCRATGFVRCQTDARLLHRLLGLTVLRVSTGQEAKGDTAFALDAVQAEQVPRLRAILLADSLAPADEAGAATPGRMLARWQPSWLRYSPLSFTGLAMIARRGRAWRIRRELGAALQHSRLAGPGCDAARALRCRRERRSSCVAVVVLASVVLSVLRSLVTYGNLVLRRDAGRAAPRARAAAGARAHLRHAPAARRNAAGAAAGAAARRRPAGRGDDGRGRRGGGVAAAAAVPRATAEAVLAELIATADAVYRPAARARRGGDAQALDAGAGAARGAADRDWCARYSWRCRSWAVAGVGGADGVLRAAGGRPGRGRSGIGWTRGWLVARAGSLERRRDCIAAAGIIGWTVRQTFLQRRAGVATLIAATAAGVKHYRVIDVPAELAWSIAGAGVAVGGRQ